MVLYNDYIDQEKPKDGIFHYTKLKGCLGILNSKSLWTTDILCLNDASEFRLAFNLGKEILEEDGRIVDYSILDRLVELLDDSSTPPPFVCSFSEKGDLLSQWRGYGDGLSTVSIGFNSRTLQKQSETQNSILLKCIYDRKKQKQILRKGYEEIYTSETDVNHIPDKYKPLINPGRFLQFLITFAPIIKDDGFKEEAEWRLISHNKENIKLRIGSSFLIPHKNFDLGSLDSAINKVIIGPTPNPEVSKHSLTLLFRELGIDPKNKIQLTDIPFRAW
jgi:hypothetical protein